MRSKLLKWVLWLWLIVFPVGLFLKVGLTPAQAIWAPTLGTWKYRQQLNVVNSSSVSLSANTTIAVVVDTKTLIGQGKLKSDCSDLRIVYQPSDTTNTVLDRHLVYPGGSNCSTSTATKVYFSLQANLSASAVSTDYYVYFGNPQAETPSNTDNAFDIGNINALLVCPFEGSTTCAAGETPTTETGAIRYSAGKSALSFDGINDKISLSQISQHDYLTAEAWVKTNKVCEEGVFGGEIIDGGYNTGGIGGSFALAVGFSNTRNAGLWIVTSAGARAVVSSGINVVDGNWHHLAATYDGSYLKIYIDGVQRGVSAWSGTMHPYYTTVTIGMEVGNRWYFQGVIDEIRVSSVVRYTSNFTPQTTPFVRDEYTRLLLHFDENGDDPRNTGKVLDDSGNGNHGTITGAKYVDGLVGVDNSSATTGYQQSGGYAAHDGIFLEESTTNKVTNPGFEHNTFNTSWEGENTNTTFNLDTATATFTPKMAKRNSAGPFAAGVMVQGKRTDATYPDIITMSRGTPINSDFNGPFTTNFDPRQGSFVFWITPEWNGNDGLKHVIFRQHSQHVGDVFKDQSGILYWDTGWNKYGSLNISSWTAGTTYCVVIRWDRINPIDASHYFSISVNDVHTYSNTVAPTLSEMWNRNNFYFGSDDINSADALVEGFTIYRRVLYDGTYGTNIGNGDEIEQIYNSGVGKDPTLITGSWDVVLALPTNAATGELTTGTGNAWSHPYASNLLYTSTTNTGGFMMNGTYTADGWADEGTPSSVTALSSAEQIFRGGYKTTSDAVNEGIYREFTATNGGDYVLRALGHSDGTCSPRVLVTRADGSTEVSHLDGTTSSNRTIPNNYLFTFESPAAENLRVKLLNTASSGTCYWHQVEVYPNLVNNPSFETGSGDPWIPTGWNNYNLDAADSVQETSSIHSGSSAYKMQKNDDYTWEGIQQAISHSTSKFYQIGVYIKYISGEANALIGQEQEWRQQHLGSGLNQLGFLFSSTTSSFTHQTAVVRNDGGGGGFQSLLLGTQASSSGIYDDMYAIELTDVSLTVTPASQVNSTETTGIRVDGRDTLTQTITGWTSTAGTVRFRFTPRHSIAIWENFGQSGGSKGYLATFYADTNNRIHIWPDYSNNRFVVFYNMGGVSATLNSANGQTFDAGTTYDMELSYQGGGSIFFKINGQTVVSGSGIPASFSSTPSMAYWGSNNIGVNIADGTFANPGKVTLTENTSSPYYKFGAKSAKLVESNSVAAQYTTLVNPGNTNTHTLSAYVYDGTTGNVGGTVSSSVVKLIFNGSAVTPDSYTDMGGGWWRLGYSATTSASSSGYGVEVQAGKTIYIDGVQLEEKAYATTYCDGTLGTGYSWSGTAHESSSSRVLADLRYDNKSISSAQNTGSISFWLKPNYPADHASNAWGVSFTRGDQNQIFVKKLIGGSNNQVQAAVNGSTVYRTSANNYFNVNKWTHLVLTWNNGGNMSFYINGSLVGTAAYSSTGANFGAFKVGSIYGYQPDATVADVRLFTGTLTSSQVSDLYNAGLVSRRETYATVTVDNFVEDVNGSGAEKGQAPTSVWNLDEGYGTTASDSSPRLNHLTISGASWGKAANNAQGVSTYLKFDGSDDYAYRDFDSDFDFGTGDFTIEGLFKHPTSISGTDTLLARYSGSTGYKVSMNSNGQLCFQVNNTASCTTTGYNDSRWHSFSAIRAPTSIALYLDGQQALQTTGLTATTVNVTKPFYLGIDSDGTSNPWDGYLDSFAIYPYARSQSQIQVDHLGNRMSAILGVRTNDNLTDGLIGWWKMDEASGGTAVDASGNGNDGTYQSTASNIPGRFANSGLFDAMGEYISTVNNFNMRTNFTYAVWIKRNTCTSSAHFIGPNGGAWAAINGDNSSGLCRVIAQVRYVNWGGNYIYSAVTAGEWTHFALTMDERYLKFFRNGVLVGTVDTDGNTIGAQTAVFGIGMLSANQPAVAPDHALDDARVYNRALSPAEVVQLYNWAPAPVAYWKLDEGTGTSAYDSSGNGNTGTLTNGPGWVNGKYGNGLSFDGSDDSILVSSPTGLDLTSNFTYSAWVYQNSSVSGMQYFYASGNVDGQYYSLGMNVGGGLMLLNDATGDTYSGNTVVRGSWRHVAVTRFGNTLTYYVDGLVDKKFTDFSVTLYSSGSKYIGRRLEGSWFFGQIDEARVYNYARTQKQIVEDMNSGHPNVGSPVGSPVAYWKLDEGYGTTANDSSVNNNFLTLSSASWTNSGKYSKAWNGAGNNWLSRADDADFDFNETDDFSVSLWFKSDSATNPSGTEYLINKSSATVAGYAIYATTGGLIRFGIDDDTTFGPDDYATSVADVYDGLWHHLVAVKTNVTRIDLYIDGVRQTPDAAIIATGSLENNLALYIGDQNGTDNGNEFNGDLDEIKFYRYALSLEEVSLDFNHGAALQLGSTGATSDGAADNSALYEYCVPGSSDPCSAPVAEWKFDEGTGTSAYDTSGNNNTGTLTNGPTWVNGKKGSAIKFDGSDDYMSLGSPIGVGTVTFNAWINLSSIGGQYPVAGWFGGGSWQFEVYGNKLRFMVWQPDRDRYYSVSYAFTKDRWYHVSVSYSTDSPANIKIYLDGNELSGSWNSLPSTSTRVYIGRIGYGGWNGEYRFSGMIDQIRIYDYVRTPAQVAWDYNRGGPIGWWKMDETEGTTAYSSSGAYNGTVFGASVAQTGKVNYAYSFDGSDDYVDVGTGPGVISSVSFWVKPATTTEYFLDLNGSAYLSSSDGALSATGFTSSTYYINGMVTTSPTLTAGVWQHVAVVTSTSLNAIDLDLGRIEGVGNLKGYLDDVRIFNYPLTSVQVKDLYTGGAVRYGP